MCAGREAEGREVRSWVLQQPSQEWMGALTKFEFRKKIPVFTQESISQPAQPPAIFIMCPCQRDVCVSPTCAYFLTESMPGYYWENTPPQMETSGEMR